MTLNSERGIAQENSWFAFDSLVENDTPVGHFVSNRSGGFYVRGNELNFTPSVYFAPSFSRLSPAARSPSGKGESEIDMRNADPLDLFAPIGLTAPTSVRSPVRLLACSPALSSDCLSACTIPSAMAVLCLPRLLAQSFACIRMGGGGM